MTTSARYRARDASRAEPAGWASNVVRPPVRISAVVPALNEAPNLEHVLTRMPRCVDEVVLVDGHSIDDTIAVARMLRPDIRVLTQCGVGKGDALACGFAAATGDIIVMLDADGSTDPQEIPQFLDVLLAGADFAKGSRFLAGGGSRDLTWLRTTGNAALCRVVNLLFGTRYTDLCYVIMRFGGTACRRSLSSATDSRSRPVSTCGLRDRGYEWQRFRLTSTSGFTAQAISVPFGTGCACFGRLFESAPVRRQPARNPTAGVRSSRSCRSRERSPESPGKERLTIVSGMSIGAGAVILAGGVVTDEGCNPGGALRSVCARRLH